MKLIFSEHTWEGYLYWQRADKKTLRRINQLIQAIQREPFSGIGKPEP
ncbi:MAG: type II toxin-antitoxin system YoeB family toxin, partial [Candidatus Thiodiazotropha endolucinida]